MKINILYQVTANKNGIARCPYCQELMSFDRINLIIGNQCKHLLQVSIIEINEEIKQQFIFNKEI